MPEAITASCPKCKAEYQLTPEQLSVADGKVRCGACMTVFQAVPPPAVKKAAAEPARPRGRGKPEKSSFVNDEDDKLLSGGKENKKPAPKQTVDDLDDDSALFGDASDEKAGSDSEDMAFSEEFDQVLKEQGFGDEGTLLADDESWAEQLLEEHGESLDDNEQEQKKKQEKKGPRTAFGSKSDDIFEEDLDELGISLSLTEGEEEALGAFGKDQLRGRITPEPLEFSLMRSRSLWMNLALGVLALLLAFSVVSQWFYFQFDELSRTQQWRGFYVSACERLDCELPDQYRIEDIRGSHLSVKSHPHYTRSLLVDAVIINHADIDQPFPKLELYFTDNEQQVVAARQFEPEEYLRGELLHYQMMPRRQPIHLALEIDDPGQRATGYRLQLSY